MIYKNQQRGFVALMSIIIMTAVVIALIFTVGVSVFFSRFSVLDGEYKRESLALAEACTNTAMVKIAQDPSYAPAATGECVSVSDTCGVVGATRTCKICSVSLSGGMYTIRTRAVYTGAYTTIEAKGSLGETNFNVSSWREVGSYAGAICTLP